MPSVHPGSIRRLRDLNNRPNWTCWPARADQPDQRRRNAVGRADRQTTQQAAGTAAVLSVQYGAAVVYIRENLVTFFDPYSQIASNIYQYVAETRIALAAPAPAQSTW